MRSQHMQSKAERKRLRESLSETEHALLDFGMELAARKAKKVRVGEECEDSGKKADDGYSSAQ